MTHALTCRSCAATTEAEMKILMGGPGWLVLRTDNSWRVEWRPVGGEAVVVFDRRGRLQSAVPAFAEVLCPKCRVKQVADQLEAGR